MLPCLARGIGTTGANRTPDLSRVGCERCRQTGYRGRVAIYEICPVNENLRRLIIRKETGSAMKQRAVLDGMTTLRDDGWRRVLAGQTTVEELVRVTQQDEALSETD